MIHSIVTEELFNKQGEFDFGCSLTVLETQDHKKNIKTIAALKNKEIYIYDTTRTDKHENNAVLNVKDHINMTGHNPLIGNQHLIDSPFVDISEIYVDQIGVVTECLGQAFEKKHRYFKYPSHYLCYFSILCAAAGISKVSARLINIRKR